MIAYVRGQVAALGLSSVVVDVGGVGLEVLCTPNTLAGLQVGSAATVPTALVVREDSLTLFGFADEDERGIFELVQTASGVGPKLAQAILAVLSPDGLRRAIGTEDVKMLTKVPGIGQKGAARIILELKDRIGTLAVSGAPASAAQDWRTQVTDGLVGLGYPLREAEKAVDAVVPEGEVEAGDVAGLLRAALQALRRP